MSPTETDLLRLAVMVYEAAAEPTLWPVFLERYNDAISGDASLLQIHDLGLRQSTILSVFGMSSPFTQAYNEHYSKLNVWREGGRAHYLAGAVNLDQEQCPRSVFESSEFYNDYLRSMDAAHSMGAVIARRQNLAPTLTALRGRRKGEFSDHERETAKFVLPYLARAWSLYEKLPLLAAGESVLDGLSIGIVFLASGGVTNYLNHYADDIFRANDGLSIRNGKPYAWDRTADAQLQKAIAHSVSPEQPPGQRAVAAPRPSGRRSYQVVVAPIRTRFRQFSGAPAPQLLLLISDPERRALSKPDLLVQLYGFTRKEAEIAVKLSDAKSVEQAADEMGITYQTARTHLRRIFSKTETSRQTELLLLLSKLPSGGVNEDG